VSAFMDSADSGEGDMLRRSGWLTPSIDADETAIRQLRDAERGVRAEEAAAKAAADDAVATRASLDGLRSDLERTIDQRVQADAASARARRAATGSGSATVRTVRTTRGQSELMARYSFGPVASMPEGLTRTGTVIEGKASWYGPGFDGRPTASGAIFDQQGFTVASRTLPLGTMLVITRGDRHVLALVNDRGPFVDGRVLDLSKGVAEALGTISAGVAVVRAEVVVPVGA
jgi:rare lipoprotein A (peptidoglycan hydrolase)